MACRKSGRQIRNPLSPLINGRDANGTGTTGLPPRRASATITIHKDSHVDHGITDAQIEWLLKQHKYRDGFFISTVEMPNQLGTVPCGLYGPLMGDTPVAESDVTYRQRSSREWASRLVARPARQVRTATIICGPHDGQPMVLYTAFGGPLAPQEPGDPGCRDLEASKAFWAEHALAV